MSKSGMMGATYINGPWHHENRLRFILGSTIQVSLQQIIYKIDITAAQGMVDDGPFCKTRRCGVKLVRE